MIIVTHSDIKAYLNCRRSWLWSYVQDFKAPEKRHGALALGSRVHKAEEHYYRTGEDPVAEHDRLARIDVEWVEDHGKGWELDDLYEDIIKGRNCVVAHQEWLATTGADSRFEVVDVERVIEVEIIEGVKLRSKVDVLFREIDTGFLYINDLKTDGGWTGGTREMLERSWQHTTYGIAATIAYPDEIIDGAFYTVMKKMKRPERSSKPLVERWPVPATRRVFKAKKIMLEQICRDMVETMGLIETEGTRHAYPSPGPECRWCDFKHPCEIVDESAMAARSMLDDKFIRGGRHARYGPS